MNVVTFMMMIIGGIDCFNIDTNNIVNILGPEGTHFGYSAVMFSNEDGQKWVVTGAIKANFTNDQNIKTPGNIYKCKLNFTQSTQDTCEPMNIKTTDKIRWPSLPGYEEDNELLGAAMSIFDDTIITCAPLWKNMIPLANVKFVHPIGRCFNIDRNLQSFTTKQFKNSFFDAKYTDKDSNQLNFEVAQIGFSISNKKYEDSLLNILIGAPGFFENKGGFLQYTGNKTIEKFFDSFTQYEFAQEAQKQGLQQGSLMGYSVSTGQLSDSESDADCPRVIVLGSPHSIWENGIVGAVFVFCLKLTDKKLHLKKQFTGEKSGSGFGSSIAFEDINGDGLDDLLIGAPLQYSDVLDSGVVYIYYGDTDKDKLLSVSGQKLQGMSKWGRFGTALQCIGDINKDGYKDVAIGAPYEESNKGAIYIYHGGYTKLTFTQKIKAQDISSNLLSFGWYISTAYDIDNNNYQDILVGSYMSNTVNVLRGRPIIKLNNTIEVFPSDIPLNSSELKCRDKLYKPCVTVRLCFSYSGDSVPDSILVDYNLSSDIRRTLSTPSKPTRVHLSSETEEFGSGNLEGKRFQVRKLSESCTEYYAIVMAVDRQFFASLEEELVMETTYRLSDTPLLGEVQPILDNALTINRDSANFSTGCNGTCHPDLRIEATLDPQEIILGVTSEVDVTVKVTNKGDQSHGTQINIDISNNTRYIGFSQPTNEVTEPVDCRNIADENNETHVQCDLRNTLFQQQIVIFNARFTVSRDLLIKDGENLGNFEQKLVFNTLVEATSADMDISDNSWKLIASVKLHVSVQLNGISRPDQLTISENEIVNFVHTYDVKNDGPSPLYNGSLEICLPVISDVEISMMTKEMIQISGQSSRITWSVVEFAGEKFNGHDNSNFTTSEPFTNQVSTISSTSNTTQQSTHSRRRRETNQMLSQEQQSKRTIKEISCNTVDSSKWAIIEIKIDLLEKDETEAFDVFVNISEDSLSFTKVSGIVYKSIATLKSENNNRQLIVATNSSSIEVPSEIFPTEVTVESEKINLWIIIGSSVGGLVLLVLLGVGLWKVGMFYWVYVYGRWVCFTGCRSMEGGYVLLGVGLWKVGMFYWV
ncbi:integrin alpha-4-like isoform X3 [Mytilus californianus]|uniref:integrin alpha-4-like isoform X2 n=1 Tax=Mytilus californianus TaxID=6549 RepID=UPI002245CD37|nr:integrin alpha-4-like isoform X2 [Mytilus californianus]XP_052096246.1 integrin alpha-4-like isoform X3 [Mytilus californianus]